MLSSLQWKAEKRFFKTGTCPRVSGMYNKERSKIGLIEL